MTECVADNSYPRLDIFLRHHYPQHSREFFRKLIKEEKVTVEGKIAKSSLALKKGQTISLSFPPAPITELIPEQIPLNILYEDDSLIVLDKQPGIVVHPAYRHPTGTLLNALLNHFNQKYPGKNIHPLLVHRLDKDTSGVLVVAKDEFSQQKIAGQFEKRTLEKVYLALVKGVIKEDRGTIDAALGRSPADRRRVTVVEGIGRSAQTLFKVKKRFAGATFLELYPKTGRTHQLRAHCAYIGHPILGDKDYGGQFAGISRPMLHAYSIKFMHPLKKEPVEFTAPLPEDFTQVMKMLGG